MKQRSCLKQKEKSCINIHSNEGLTEHTNRGGNMPGQNNCFSAGQESEEELYEKRINIMANLTEAGECLPLIEVNRIEYHAQDEANGQEVELDQTELRPPPLRSEINKVRRIRISEIKPDNI